MLISVISLLFMINFTELIAFVAFFTEPRRRYNQIVANPLLFNAFSYKLNMELPARYVILCSLRDFY